jgi:hypothetical protein
LRRPTLVYFDKHEFLTLLIKTYFSGSVAVGSASLETTGHICPKLVGDFPCCYSPSNQKQSKKGVPNYEDARKQVKMYKSQNFHGSYARGLVSYLLKKVILVCILTRQLVLMPWQETKTLVMMRKAPANVILMLMEKGPVESLIVIILLAQ